MQVWLGLCSIGSPEPGVLETLSAELGPAERTRMAGFAAVADRLSYCVAHVLLRRALARRIDSGAEWRFGISTHGKPCLDPPRPGVDFSLSHTPSGVAVALSCGGAVGVDIESRDRAVGKALFEDLVLAPAERAELAMHADQRQRMLQLWVVKEAVAKAAGLGLALSFPSVVALGDPVRLASLPDDLGPAERWWLCGGSWAGHCVAIAAMAKPAAIRSTAFTLRALVDTHADGSREPR